MGLDVGASLAAYGRRGVFGVPAFRLPSSFSIASFDMKTRPASGPR